MKHVIISALLLTSQFASATLEQVWQVDISSYWGGFNRMSWYETKLCNDGYILISTSSADVTQNYVMVIDKNGQFVDRDIYPSNATEFDGQGPSTFFLLRGSDETRYYELTNNVLSVTTIEGSEFGYWSIHQPAKHNEFITLNNDILTKYRHLPSNPNVETTSMGVVDGNFVISWNSEPGAIYQVQTSTNMTNWVNTGVSLTGTGDTMTWANVISNSSSFYRLITD